MAIEEKNSGYVIGIDLGTTNTAVAVFKKGEPQNIKMEGAKTLPSVVRVLKNGEMLVGAPAKAGSLIDPESTVNSVKRQMGSDWKKSFSGIPDKEYTPADISCFILEKVKECILEDQDVDIKGNPKYAVICVPANFDDAKRAETKKAGELAGLEVVYLLEEPIAAAYAYGMEKTRDQTILVYDLGGGTFDVAILKVDTTNQGKKSLKVLAKEGIEELGGDDFDHKIMMFAAEKLNENSGIDIMDLAKDQGVSVKKILEAQQKLRETAMNAKHTLTDATTARLDIPNLIKDGEGQPHSVEMEITRDQFNDSVRDLVFHSKEAVENALNSAEMDMGDIDRIILVGGSTKMPIVKEMLTEMFGGKEPYSDTDPDMAIARGASIRGAMLTNPNPEDEPVDDIDQLDGGGWVEENKTSLDLGIAVYGGKFNTIIEKGSELPISASKDYVTSRDNMTEITIAVYQGPQEAEYTSDEGVKCIGEFFLTGIPPKPKGQESITVTFEFNEENLLMVRASSSGGEKELEINKG
jgi:molecular chaperone DnaK